MIRIGTPFAAALALFAAVTVLFAHEVTYTGTVVALKTSKFAQPDGSTREVRELEATVADPKTKKPLNKVFTINEKTGVLRAGKPISLADLTARKDEKVAVVVDHDVPGDIAITVRIDAAK